MKKKILFTFQGNKLWLSCTSKSHVSTSLSEIMFDPLPHLLHQKMVIWYLSARPFPHNGSHLTLSGRMQQSSASRKPSMKDPWEYWMVTSWSVKMINKYTNVICDLCLEGCYMIALYFYSVKQDILAVACTKFQQNFAQVPWEVGDIEFESTIFRPPNYLTGRSAKAVVAYRGGNPWIHS